MLTSKARLLAALKGEQPDRVPVVVTRNLLGDNAFTRAPSYRRLVEYAREHADLLFKEFVGTVRYLDLYPRFNRDMSVRIPANDRETRQITLETPKGALHREVRNVPGTIPEVLRATTRHFIRELDDIDRYLSIPYAPDDVGIESVREVEREIGERGLVQVTFWDPVGAVCDQIDPEQFAIWSVMERRKLKRFVEIMSERIEAEVHRFLDAGVGEVFYFNGPEFVLPPSQPPAFFDEFVVAFDRRLCRLVHDHDKLVMFHCHGKVRDFLGKFADMGVDALHPLEPPPHGDVDLGAAKRQYGGRLCLVGNIQYAELMENTPREIETRVQGLIRDAGAGGGLVVSPCSGLYEATLPEKTARNYMAMISAARLYGNYPL